MQTIWAAQALTGHGWQNDVLVTIDDAGQISDVTAGAPRSDQAVDILLPAPCNLHSHAFQRAMAGLTERRGPEAHDSFWTWRDIMYKFVDQLGPDEISDITAFAQMEMLEAGFAAVAEFHYLHHRPDGAAYDNIAETSLCVANAARQSGIGLTLLPVFYQQGGCDGRALSGGQKRFGNSLDQYTKLLENSRSAIGDISEDSELGVAAHSLRAVSPEGLKVAVSLSQGGPIHIHIAEQQAEIDEVTDAYGARPVAWLLETQPVDKRWCLVHATHMTEEETASLASTDAVAGICPITEANLGDGIFNGAQFHNAGGRFGVGTDSNVHISLSEELRLFEYSQRLREQARAVLATAEKSTGRVLFEGAAAGGAQAAGRNAGTIESGKYADLLALDARDTELEGLTGDAILDTYIFASGDHLVTDVWSAGRRMVTGGRHVHKEEITARYRHAMARLKAHL